MQGLTVGLLMHEQLRQIREDSPAARRAAALRERRRVNKEAHSHQARDMAHASEPDGAQASTPFVDFLPRLTGYPFSR